MLGQRVHEGEVPAVPRSMQGGCGFRDVLTNDRDVANLAITVPELVVGKADGPGVVGDFRVFQRAPVQGDGAGLVAARGSQTSMQPPQRRQPSRRNGFAQSIGGAAEDHCRLIQIVLQQPCFGEHRSERQLVAARQ